MALHLRKRQAGIGALNRRERRRLHLQHCQVLVRRLRSETIHVLALPPRIACRRSCQFRIVADRLLRVRRIAQNSKQNFNITRGRHRIFDCRLSIEIEKRQSPIVNCWAALALSRQSIAAQARSICRSVAGPRSSALGRQPNVSATSASSRSCCS
jgi:hypothetical protein